MRPGGGKGKGSSYERDICKVLSLWWTDGSNPDVFWRTASSGGRATQRGLTVHRGDITNIEDEGKKFIKVFVIECKFYRDIDIIKVLDSEKNSWLDWWDQVCTDAILSGRNPLLIMKRNRGKSWIALDKETWDLLTKNKKVDFSTFLYTGKDAIIITLLENFLKIITPKDIEGLNGHTRGHSF